MKTRKSIASSFMSAVVALCLLLSFALPARASVASLASAGISALRAHGPALTLAQIEDEHEHAEGLESESDPWSNIAVPLLMIAGGLLYIGFVRWKIRRRHRAEATRVTTHH